MRRAGFFTAEFYRHLTGVRALRRDRRLGAGGHDQQHRFEVLEPIAAPDGLGVVAEYRSRGPRTTRPLKVTLPGPYTLSGRLTLRPGPGLPDARTPPPRRSCRSCGPSSRAWSPAGATFIQIDDPSPAIHPDAPSDFAALFNAAVAPVRRVGSGSARTCASGTTSVARSRAGPTGRSSTRCSGSEVDELVLEFANREMAEVEHPRRDRRGRPATSPPASSTSRTTTSRSADEVAERIDAVLAAGVPPERLTLVPDCGFSQTARWATTAKLRALVAGRDLVLGHLRPTATDGGSAWTATPSRCSAPG